MATVIGKQCVYARREARQDATGKWHPTFKTKGIIVKVKEGYYLVKWSRKTNEGYVDEYQWAKQEEVQVYGQPTSYKRFSMAVAIHKQQIAKTEAEATAAYNNSCNSCCNINCSEYKCPVYLAYKEALVRIEAENYVGPKAQQANRIIKIRKYTISPMASERKKAYHILNKASEFYDKKNSTKAVEIDDIIIQMDLDKTMGVAVIARLCEDRELTRVACLIRKIK